MSLLPPEVHSALSQLLGALTAADNALRSQAEEQLNNDWAQNRPDILLMGLVEQIQGAEDTIVSICLLACLSVQDSKRGGALRFQLYGEGGGGSDSAGGTWWKRALSLLFDFLVGWLR